MTGMTSWPRPRGRQSYVGREPFRTQLVSRRRAGRSVGRAERQENDDGSLKAAIPSVVKRHPSFFFLITHRPPLLASSSLACLVLSIHQFSPASLRLLLRELALLT